MYPFQQFPQFLLCIPNINHLDSQYFLSFQQQQQPQLLNYQAFDNINVQPLPTILNDNQIGHLFDHSYGQNPILEKENSSPLNQTHSITKQIKPVEISKTAKNQKQGLRQSALLKDSPIIKQKRKSNKRIHKRTYNIGHWTKKEHRLYLAFIEQYRDVFEDPCLKKQEKVFKQMSEVIKTRCPSQCRSHHQKFDPLELQNQKSEINLRIDNEEQ